MDIKKYSTYIIIYNISPFTIHPSYKMSNKNYKMFKLYNIMNTAIFVLLHVTLVMSYSYPSLSIREYNTCYLYEYYNNLFSYQTRQWHNN